MSAARTAKSLRIIHLLIAVLLINFPAYAKYNSGTGEPNDPYQIATAEDLMLLGDSPEDYDKHFIMTADINLDPNLPGRKVFDKAIIAPRGTSFTGVFDGNSHTISQMTIAGGARLGLFGGLGSGGEVKDLGVVDVNVTGTDGNIGGLVGDNIGVVIGCYSTGSIVGDDFVGGLVGRSAGTLILCYSSIPIRANGPAGGLVGANVGEGLIKDCYAEGSVVGSVRLGGLVCTKSSPPA